MNNSIQATTSLESFTRSPSSLDSIPSNTISTRYPLNIGMLSNPLSGRNKRNGAAIHRAIASHSSILHAEAQSPDEMTSALFQFASKDVNLVVINGGDGTVQAILTGLFHHRPFKTSPLLAIVPSGTSNMTAGDVGLTGNRERAFNRLLAWAQGHQDTAQILTRPVMKILLTPDQDPLYGMFVGMGAIYQGTQMCRRTKKSLGRFGEIGAGLILGRFLLSLATGNHNYMKPIPMTVTQATQPDQHQECLSLFVTTLERLILGLQPFWGTEPGSLHYTAVHAQPKQKLRVFPSLLFGKPHAQGTPQNGYVSHNVDEVQIQMNSGLTIDGELFMPEPQRGPLCLSNGGTISFVRF